HRRPGDARRTHGLCCKRPADRDLARRLSRRPHPDRVRVGDPMTNAIIFDFNGTLSDDEPIMCEIFIELFAEHGKPLSAQEYFDRLAGLSDPEIVRRWLGHDHPDVDEVIDERVSRYRTAVADGSTIPESVREAVRYTAERVPAAVVTGATRAEVEPVLAAAGLLESFAGIVSADDVVDGKPHPESYLR